MSKKTVFLKKVGQILDEVIDLFAQSAEQIKDARRRAALKRQNQRLNASSTQTQTSPQGTEVDGATGVMRSSTVSTQVQMVDKTPNKNSPSKDGNGNNTSKIDETKVDGCPVSLINGEELLDIEDTVLPGALPFSFSRVYRTTAIDKDIGLGPGWSHSLNHSLSFTNQGITWHNSENATTHFPQPSEEQPKYYNRLASGAIYLGREPNQYILANEGLFYHFKRLSNNHGQLIEISDIHNNRWQLEYDTLQRPVKLCGAHGVGLSLRYQGKQLIALDRLSCETASANWQVLKTIVEYHYSQEPNHFGQLIKTHSTNNTEQYHYDSLGVIDTRIMASGLRFSWQWQYPDSDDAVDIAQAKQVRCIKHWSNAGFEVHYQWDDKKHQVTLSHLDGSSEVYQHDENAKLISQTDPDGAVSQFSYDENGHLIKEINALGAITEHIYNDQGEKTATIAPDQSITRFSYWRGNLTNIYQDQVVDDNLRQNAIEWRYRYNRSGQVIMEMNPLRERTEHQYYDNGRLKSTRYPDGQLEQFEYNRTGELIRHQQTDGSSLYYQYDKEGLLLTERHSTTGETRYQYTTAGLVSRIINPQGHERQYRYNHWGKVIEEIDEHNNRSQFEYHPHLPLLLTKRSSDGSELHYQYDSRQRFVTQIRNEKNEHYFIDYYPNGHIRKERTFDCRTFLYEYDLTGNVIKKSEIGDQGTELVTQLSYNEMGKLVEKQLPDGQKIRYEYDYQGQLSIVNDGNTPLAWHYDLAGRVIEEQQGWASQKYHYDSKGRLIRQQLVGFEQLHWNYDANGLVESLKLNNRTISRHQYREGQETSRQQGQRSSQYRYDKQGRLSAQAHAVSLEQQTLLNTSEDNLPQLERHYQYDNIGQLTQIKDSLRGKQRYQYDSKGQLTHASRSEKQSLAITEYGSNLNDDYRASFQENFFYDSAGNALGHPNSQVKYNQLVKTPNIDYKYDEFGNLSEKIVGKIGGKDTTFYRYDCQHRLIKTTLPNGNTVDYKYDAFGRRVSKTFTKTDTQGQNTTHETQYQWQGDLLVQESDSQEKHQAYIYEPDSFRPLALIKIKHSGHLAFYDPDTAEQLPQIYHYHNDHLGTPQEITDEGGNIIWSVQMKAWGNIYKHFIKQIDNPLRFQGQYHDEETGLHYNRHRYYDPEAKRFISPDPIGLAGGINSYQYVTNPVSWIDPLGLSQVAGGVGGCQAASSTKTQETDTTGRPIQSPQYSLWYQTELPPNILNSSRRVHFKNANEQLYLKTKQDPLFADTLPDEVLQHIQPGPRGGFADTSPPNQTWHHNAYDPTKIELVPRGQHRARGAVQNTLHPNQQGGFNKLRNNK